MARDDEEPRPSVLRRALSRILALNRAEASTGALGGSAPGGAEHGDAPGMSDEPHEPQVSQESRLGGLALGDTRAVSASARSSVPDRFGRYVILDELGEGGLSVVYSAYDPELDRKLAIKLVRTGKAGGEPHTRLLREAQAIARLSHPNVIQVFDAGESEGQLFVAMELIHGQTLRAWLRHEQLDYWARSPNDRDAAGSPRLTRRTKSFELARARPWQETLAVFIEAGRGLAAAHAAGVIHRDFKPDNVMIDRDRRVRVLDFGLARSMGHGATPERSIEGVGPDTGSVLGTDLTRTGTIMGTPAYMSPEQLDGAPSDARTDQFSYCVALYEAVFGERPFGGQSLAALMASISQGPKPPPTGATVPLGLWPMLRRGLARAPLGRYPSMDDLLVDLQSLIQSRPRRWRRWLRWVGGGAASAAVAGLLGWTLLRERAAAHLCALEPTPLHGGSSTDARELHARLTAWRAAQQSACEAPALEPAVSRCLERQRVELDELSRSTAVAEERVAEVIARLPPPEACGARLGRAGLESPPIMEHAIRARIQLALGAAQWRILANVRDALAELESSGDDVELAEMLLVIASVDEPELDALRGSPEGALYRAVERAEAAARPDIAARAWLDLVDRRMTSDPATARELLRVALTALARAGHPPWIMARWHDADARLAAASGPAGLERAAKALESQLEALQAAELRSPERERAVVEQLVTRLRETNRTGEADRWSQRLAETSEGPLP
jgi:serine/threonine protein kinase